MAVFWDVASCSLVGVYCLHHQDIECISLMTEAVSTSEMLVNFYQTMWCNISEDCCLHTCCCENLKSNL
jgi:hypothetical protein